ncbi:MAG: SHOCT domain-containing protein [Clostridia bacterium]|nr:SHOCT domain-containing protein [Clostridia bacterium]
MNKKEIKQLKENLSKLSKKDLVIQVKSAKREIRKEGIGLMVLFSILAILPIAVYFALPKVPNLFTEENPMPAWVKYVCIGACAFFALLVLIHLFRMLARVKEIDGWLKIGGIEKDFSNVPRTRKPQAPQVQKKAESAPQVSDTRPVKEQLKELKEMLDAGLINESDFEAKKKQILGI